jgi:hypothetical protein
MMRPYTGPWSLMGDNSWTAKMRGISNGDLLWSVEYQ